MRIILQKLYSWGRKKGKLNIEKPISINNYNKIKKRKIT